MGAHCLDTDRYSQAVFRKSRLKRLTDYQSMQYFELFKLSTLGNFAL